MFKNIVMNFNNNYELCKIFVNSDYLPKDIQLLYHFVVNGTINNNEVIDLESLRNYKQTVYEKNCNLINNENVYGHELLEQIFKLLCNKTYNEIDILINQLFSVDRIDELLLTVHNEDMREELKNYRVFMELSESIRSIWGIDSLKNILMALNEKFISNSRDLEIIWSTFKNITEIAKRFYGEEIKEKITDFSILGDMDSTAVVHGIEECDETSKVILRKARYSTGEYSYQEVQYTSKDVDLIELNGIPFVSFAHVLNAYGSGATLSDFKNPRLIGRTYICLSAIDDEKFGTVSRDVIDMDHVTLLFSSFNSEQLALASNRDIGSYGADNNLALTGGSNNFRPVRSVISNTYDGENGYNEYVMYREDGNGNIIYPSAVLVTGSEPNEFEIRAASYLGVPLVRINKSKYLNAVGYEITPNDIIPSDFLNKKVKWVSLKRSIEQIYDNILGSGSETKLVDDGAKKI